MSFLEMYGKEIFSLLVPLVTWALNTFLKSKAKLHLGKPHSFTFLVEEPLVGQQGEIIAPRQTVHTDSYVLTNSGRETATKVELVFNFKPKCINFWPSRHYEERTENDGRYTILFDSLSPKENLGFELFNINSELPPLLVARCDQCVADTINMAPQPVAERWKVRTVAFLALAGLFLVVYATILILQFLVLKTPYGH